MNSCQYFSDQIYFQENTKQNVDQSFDARVNDVLSSLGDAFSGIPQGSVIQSPLSLLHINNLPYILFDNVLIFTDLAKIIFIRSDYLD